MVEKIFTIGSIKYRGIRLCEPCAYMSGILHSDVLKKMVHRAGLRAQIIRCERKPRLRIKEVKFERIVGKPRIFSKSFFWAARHSRAIAYLDDDGTGCGCLLGHNAADTLARHGGALKECNT